MVVERRVFPPPGSKYMGKEKEKATSQQEYKDLQSESIFIDSFKSESDKLFAKFVFFSVIIIITTIVEYNFSVLERLIDIER